MEEGKTGVENLMTWTAMQEYFYSYQSKKNQKNPKPQPTNNIDLTSILMFTFWLDPAKCPFSRIK